MHDIDDSGEIEPTEAQDPYSSLLGSGYLTDIVIDDFGKLLIERSELDPQLPKVHVFTTHFYTTFVRHGYPDVRQFTHGGRNGREPEVDVFGKDFVFVPIHRPGPKSDDVGHWVLVVINIPDKSLTHYDPMKEFVNTTGERESRNILEYLHKEFEENRESSLPSGWHINPHRETRDIALIDNKIPIQHNWYDCGVFVCTYMEHLSRRVPFSFDQQCMPSIRSGMYNDLQHHTLTAPYHLTLPSQSVASIPCIRCPSPEPSDQPEKDTHASFGEFQDILLPIATAQLPPIPRLPAWKKEVLSQAIISYQHAIEVLTEFHLRGEITLQELAHTKNSIDNLFIFGILEDERKRHSYEQAKHKSAAEAYKNLLIKRRCEEKTPSTNKDRLYWIRFQFILRDAKKQAEEEFKRHWELLRKEESGTEKESQLVEIIRCFEDTLSLIEQYE